MSTQILDRLDRVEHELGALQREVRQIRATVQGGTVTTQSVQEPPVRVVAAPPTPAAPRAPMPPLEPPPEPAFWEKVELPAVKLPKLDAADLVGARGLALAGGVVTLLGVVFFFVLAANNGWIGPVARILLGGGASALVFAAGIVAHARYGRLHASVAAAGAGIAGGYATLLAAAALYDLVSAPIALALAAAIASAGVALSLHWRSEVVAALGLLGAMAVPAIVILDGSLTPIGTAFVGIVFAAATLVSIRQRWSNLLIAAATISVPQILALVIAEDEPVRGRVVVLALAFVALYLAAGIGRQIRSATAQLDPLGSVLAAGAAFIGFLSAFTLLEGDARGLVLSGLALAYVGLALAFWRDEELHELAVLGAAFGTAFAATATAQFLDGPSLVVAWAAEGVMLAWLGRRIAETRFQLVSLAYLALALAYTLGHEAPLDTLYTAGADFLDGVPALAAVGAALVGFALLAGCWPTTRGGAAMPEPLAELVCVAERNRPLLRIAAFALGGLVLLDAASLAVLDAAERLNLDPSFGWGHVGVTALWSLVALAALALGRIRNWGELMIGGLGLLGAALVSFEFFTGPDLGDPQIGWSAAILAIATAAAPLIAQRILAVTVGGVALSVALTGAAVWKLLEGDARGYALAAVALGYVAVAGLLFSRRNVGTSFWTAGVVVSFASSVVLLDGTWLVLAWAIGAALLAAAGRFFVEPRFWFGAGALTGIAGLDAIGTLAEPEQFVRASSTPAGGVPALLLVLGALAAIAVSIRRFEPDDGLDRAIDGAIDEAGRVLRWILAGLGLYAASLTILAIAQELSGASITTAFQRGHTGVSAFWGLVALSALVLGLRRQKQALRLAAVGLFALALGKLFLYDLSTLSSVTRAASFLAVGAVLLLAGFLYQRLATD